MIHDHPPSLNFIDSNVLAMIEKFYAYHVPYSLFSSFAFVILVLSVSLSLSYFAVPAFLLSLYIPCPSIWSFFVVVH